MRRCLITIALLTIFSTVAAQEVDTAWVRQFARESTTEVGITKMDLDSAGNPILIGWSTTGASVADFLVLKFYSTGDTAWMRNFDFPEHGDDRATSISIVKNQQIMAISGDCNRYIWDSGYAATIVLSADGAPLDTVYHPMETVIWNQIGFWLAPIGTLELVVVGTTSPYNVNLKMRKTLFGFEYYSTEVENFYPFSLVASANQSAFYVAGRSGLFGNESFSTAAVSTSDLDTNWLRREPAGLVTSISPTLIVAFGNDGVVVAGGYRNMTWTEEPRRFRWMTYRYNVLGTRLWTGEYTTCNGIPKSICVDQSGNTIIAGQTQANYACAQSVPDSNQILILKYDSGGELTWDFRHSVPGVTKHDVVASVVDSQGNLYVAANVLDNVAGTDNDIIIMRVNTEGEIDWTYTYASAGGDRDLATAMRLDQQGNLYIAGTSNGDKVLLLKLIQNTVVEVDDPETPVLPAPFQLSQNYPNPFNPSTEFWYTLDAPIHAIVEIFSINGALVRKLVDDDQLAGSHRVLWNGTDNSGRGVASGVYLYRLRAAGQSASKKMTLIK